MPGTDKSDRTNPARDKASTRSERSIIETSATQSNGKAVYAVWPDTNSGILQDTIGGVQF